MKILFIVFASFTIFMYLYLLLLSLRESDIDHKMLLGIFTILLEMREEAEWEEVAPRKVSTRFLAAQKLPGNIQEH